ncbi:hypothetical protein HMPREF0580_1411 [Mobiluncus mulieris ATCC 35239]|uniref:Uncharacterized protein n=1 Tax=Mobiluncus mulieris ATCC 35239 TaxID=871571 RepID=E0QR96_9ACTO|nr:hypothetical protein HMPREF0580_1411 [Mobiluncus mulieris ATCC 35239]
MGWGSRGTAGVSAADNAASAFYDTLYVVVIFVPDPYILCLSNVCSAWLITV